MSLYQHLGLKYPSLIMPPDLDEGKSFEFDIKLRNGKTKYVYVKALRRVDAFIEVIGVAEFEGWDDQITGIDIREAGR